MQGLPGCPALTRVWNEWLLLKYSRSVLHIYS